METHYITYINFDHELLAIYLSIRHFPHFLKGRNFHVITDHKPFIYSLATNSDHYSPCQICQLDFISQFTSDTQHINGQDNPVADALLALIFLPFSNFCPQLTLDFSKKTQRYNEYVSQLPHSSFLTFLCQVLTLNLLTVKS